MIESVAAIIGSINILGTGSTLIVAAIAFMLATSITRVITDWLMLFVTFLAIGLVAANGLKASVLTFVVIIICAWLVLAIATIAFSTDRDNLMSRVYGGIGNSLKKLFWK